MTSTTPSTNNAEQTTTEMGVVDQVVLAFKPRNRLATILGFIGGGSIPVATYLEAHHELDWSAPLYTQAAFFLVLGGLLVSAKTVFEWTRLAFQDRSKAVGFVVLLEGVMVTSHIPVLPLAILALLIGINGVACGCTLTLGRAAKTANGAAPEATVTVKKRATKAPASRKRRVSGVELKAA